MLTLDTAFGEALKAKTALIISDLKDGIAIGTLNFDGYQYECGKIKGMLMVLDYIDEINQKLMER